MEEGDGLEGLLDAALAREHDGGEPVFWEKKKRKKKKIGELGFFLKEVERGKESESEWFKVSLCFPFSSKTTASSVLLFFCLLG